MRLGRLNRRVTILKRVQVGTSPLGAPMFEWQDSGAVWAELTHNSEDEKHAASITYAERIVTFRMHFRDDLTEVDKLVCEGNEYGIKGQREVGFREGLEIKAEWTTPV